MLWVSHVGVVLHCHPGHQQEIESQVEPPGLKLTPMGMSAL